MQGTVDFMMVTQLNQILKEHHIAYSLHTIVGCASCGLELRCEGKEESLDEILNLINHYLSQKWLVASLSKTDQTMLYIDSKFDHI